MDLLAQDGHVSSPTIKHSEKGPRVEFTRIGRNHASTFTGFCSTHDAEIFRAIDQHPLDRNNMEQLFLLAYRAVARELHAVMEGAARIQGTYQYRVERGYDSGTATDSAGQLATAHLIKSYDTYRYRCDNFDRPLLLKSYKEIQHDVFVLLGQVPVIAASATFSLDGLAGMDGTPRATLNILPTSQTETIVIFSYSEKHSGTVRTGLNRIFQAGGDYQKYEISKLMLESTENFVISPSHFDSWPKDKKEPVRSEFERTLLGGSVIEDAGLMLF